MHRIVRLDVVIGEPCRFAFALLLEQDAITHILIVSVFTEVRFYVRSGIPGHIPIVTGVVNEARSAIGANRTVLRMPDHVTFRLVGENYREIIAGVKAIAMRGVCRDVLTSKPLHIGCVVSIPILESDLRIDTDMTTCLPCSQIRFLGCL